jgi:hypothetical protein
VNFLIQRPISAMFIVLVMILAGAVAVVVLPIAQYPTRLTHLGPTAMGSENAVRNQYQQVAAGKIGQAPALAGPTFQYQLNTPCAWSRCRSSRTSSCGPTPTVRNFGAVLISAIAVPVSLIGAFAWWKAPKRAEKAWWSIRSPISLKHPKKKITWRSGIRLIERKFVEFLQKEISNGEFKTTRCPFDVLDTTN